MKKTEFEEKLIAANLTKNHFSKLTKTPIGTINNWMAKRKGTYSDCPKWVEAYINLYIENNENKIYIKKLTEELRKDNVTNQN